MQTDGRQQNGFTCCKICRKTLMVEQMPPYTIANNYCFGTSPPELVELTDVELALLTSVKIYGYCFNYTGGLQKCLKGSLTYYKIDITKIIRTVMHFDMLAMMQNIVIMLSGVMISKQYRKARCKNKIRTYYVLHAMEWLLYHNKEWQHKNINLNYVRENLQTQNN